jgi:hypothetical protein
LSCTLNKDQWSLLFSGQADRSWQWRPFTDATRTKTSILKAKQEVRQVRNAGDSSGRVARFVRWSSWFRVRVFHGRLLGALQVSRLSDVFGHASRLSGSDIQITNKNVSDGSFLRLCSDSPGKRFCFCGAGMESQAPNARQGSPTMEPTLFATVLRESLRFLLNQPVFSVQLTRN